MDFLGDISFESPAGYIGLFLLLFGGFMVLAGFDIISIQQISVKKGRRTWILGFAFSFIGIVLLFPEFSTAPDTPASVEPTSTTASSSNAEIPNISADWSPITIQVPNDRLWLYTADGAYTAIGQTEQDAFAWSTKTYEGNLSVKMDIESTISKSSGCIIVYGDGNEHSYGSLIFCIDWDGYGLERHTTYHEGENYYMFIHRAVDLKDNPHAIAIEIREDNATMFVNGEKVFSAYFDLAEIDRSGKIGLLKKWFDPEVTFSNLQIRSLNDN